jgi:TusA-related sulfurtransferase/rhodanese-related sulfurtransferase
VLKLKDEEGVKEVKITKFKMYMKYAKIILNRLFRGKWILPGVNEITVDQLYDILNSEAPPILIDVRDRVDFYAEGKGSYMKYGHIPDSKSIPIMQLTSNFDELASLIDREIVTICPGGGMSLVAAELMVKAGFANAKSLKGGLDAWNKKGYIMTTEYNPEFPLEDKKSKPLEEKISVERYIGKVDQIVDARGESCPKPILMTKKTIDKMEISQVLEILTTDPASLSDIPAWAKVTGQELVSTYKNTPEEFRFIVKKIK